MLATAVTGLFSATDKSWALVHTAPEPVTVAECDTGAQARRVVIQRTVELKLEALKQAHQCLDCLLRAVGGHRGAPDGRYR